MIKRVIQLSGLLSKPFDCFLQKNLENKNINKLANPLSRALHNLRNQCDRLYLDNQAHISFYNTA
ncbi:protein of unknown function [Legionella micdadei]|uniref:Uncharacterized protein n=1 Tax=Legionella micdadei TaxID=451 RepID=A0A098GJJ4_LEGMI|nr:protein of unknown function [Legionella micdadei]